MNGTLSVMAGAIAFVGTHFAMSHPLRRPLVARLGEGGFAGLYSLVAFVTLGITIRAYVAAPVTAPAWPVGDLARRTPVRPQRRVTWRWPGAGRRPAAAEAKDDQA